MYPTTRRHVPESRNPQLCVESVTRPQYLSAGTYVFLFPLETNKHFMLSDYNNTVFTQACQL